MLLFSSHKRLITSAFNCHPSGLFPRSIALLFCLASRGKQNKKVVTFSTMGILCKWAAFVPFFFFCFCIYERKKKAMCPRSSSWENNVLFRFTDVLRCRERQDKLSVHFQGISCPTLAVSFGQHETRALCTFPSHVISSMSTELSIFAKSQVFFNRHEWPSNRGAFRDLIGSPFRLHWFLCFCCGF